MPNNPTVNFKEEIAKDMSEGGFNVHDDLKDLSVPELRNICDDQRFPFAVCCISVTGDMNISSIIRTACLFGAERVLVSGRKKFDRRGLVGANNYIDIDFLNGLNQQTLEIDSTPLINALKKHDYFPVLIEQGGRNLGTFNWPALIGDKKPCLIVGNENRGIPENIINAIKEMDHLYVSIPQLGVLRSHNVSVAAGIVVSHMTLEMGWFAGTENYYG